MNHDKPLVLLVDDDPDDLFLLHEAFENSAPNLTINEARDGVEALRQLNALHAKSALPSLIVLDINMPRMDGKETLVAIKANEKFSTIPVVVFSTSSNDTDKKYFAEKKVEVFTKPWNSDKFYNIVSKLLAYVKVSPGVTLI